MKLKNKKMLIVVILIIFIMSIVLLNLCNNSSFKKTNVNIYYRIYNQKYGWSNWVKNGKECGFKNGENIENIQIKLKNKKENAMTYNIYNGIWNNELTVDRKIKNKNIKGLEIEIYKELSLNYSVCYSTHNNKNLWFGWACDGQTSGNKEETMNSVKIKIVPKNAVLDEYLDNYSSSAVTSKNF